MTDCPRGWQAALETVNFDKDGIGDVVLQHQDDTLAFWPEAAAEVMALEQVPGDAR